MAKIILASGSPRRQELIGKLFGNYEVRVSGAEEKTALVRPHSKVMALAQIKSYGIEPQGDEVVISADTLVYLGGKYYGKPKSEQGAVDMLKELVGRTHFVYTGVCVKTAKKKVVFYDKSAVTFKPLNEAQIIKYIKEFKPLDKAGAYGLQDGQVVKNYKGSYTNIIGLPMEKLKKVLIELGVM